VRLRTDNSTQKSGVISQGDRIEANVDEQNLVLSVRSAQEERPVMKRHLVACPTLLTSPVRPAQRNASKNLVQRETPGLRPVQSMSVKETP
jgi:hypothetical protein